MNNRAGKSNQGRLRQATDSWPKPAITEWLDAIAAPILLLNSQAKILHSNQACLDTTGYSMAELCDRYLWELSPPTEQPAVRHDLQALANQPTAISGELTWVYKSGKNGVWTWTANPLSNPQGSGQTWVVTGKPISSTPSNRPEHQPLTRAEELAIRHFQSSDALSILFNATQGCSPETGEPLGSGAVGQSITDVTPMEPDHPQYEAALYRLMVGTAFATGKQSQTLLQLVLDTLPLSIFWKDCNCVYLGCNKQMLADAGLTSLADMVGKTDFDLPWSHEAKLYRANDLEVMETGQPQLNVEEPMTKSGNLYRWLRTTKIPLRDSAGKIIGVLGFFQDITEHKQLETQLRQSNERLALANVELTRATRLKDEFLANMNHELRTPLSSILGMTQALSREIYGPMTERQHRSLAIVERSGRHLLSLINEILEVAKIEAGRIDLHWEDLSVQKLCEESLVFVQQHALQKHIRLTSKIDPNVTTLRGDGLRLKQALINLLDNALKFTPEAGQVELNAKLGTCNHHSSAQSGEMLILSVADTGIGIAPEDQPRLFQSFVQLDSSLNRQYFGTGLGLALVKYIVELHGGTVEVKSQLNQGSRFTLYLPQNLRPEPNTQALAGETDGVRLTESAESL
jgi:PAS domain S-box-containing protein